MTGEPGQISYLLLKCNSKLCGMEEWAPGTLCCCVGLDEMGYHKCGSSQQDSAEGIQGMPKACAKCALLTPAEKHQETFPLGTAV